MDRFAMAPFDAHTRWRCPYCGRDGIDSWHKSAFDGFRWEDGPPDDLGAFGFFCTAVDGCEKLLVVDYRSPKVPPRCIIAGGLEDPTDRLLAAESAAFASFEADRFAGAELQPADTRDGDWSGGCLNVRPSPPVGGAAE
uniref:hypothetical protein n=1 Tax=Stappia sp. TaxID=1870903 RepID=UPI003BAD2EED